MKATIVRRSIFSKERKLKERDLNLKSKLDNRNGMFHRFHLYIARICHAIFTPFFFFFHTYIKTCIIKKKYIHIPVPWPFLPLPKQWAFDLWESQRRGFEVQPIARPIVTLPKQEVVVFSVAKQTGRMRLKIWSTTYFSWNNRARWDFLFFWYRLGL